MVRSPEQDQRPPSLHRLLLVAFRTVHILAMALVLGALPYGPAWAELRVPMLATVGSGLALLALDLAKDPRVLFQGSSVMVLVKLLLLGCGQLWPGQRLAWYLAAAAVASVGSHMPGYWRHRSLLRCGAQAS